MAAGNGEFDSLLLCCLIAGVFAIPEFIKHIEYIWKKSWLGYLMVAVGFGWLAWFTWHVPPSGYAITAMAVVAGIMALRPEMGGWERSLWFVLLLFFAVVEIRAINKDRVDQSDKFKQIATGLQTSIDQGTKAIKALNTTINEGREHFDATMSGLKDTVNTETGGTSFCYIDFGPALDDVGLMTVVKVGKYPLHGISAEIIDQARTQAAVEGLFKNHHPTPDEVFMAQKESTVREVIPDFATPSRFMGGYQMTKNDRQSFEIVFIAFNGSWIERLQIREVSGKWVKAMMVEAPQRKSRFFKIDPGFPRVNGELDVPGWPRPVKGKPEWER